MSNQKANESAQLTKESLADPKINNPMGTAEKHEKVKEMVNEPGGRFSHMKGWIRNFVDTSFNQFGNSFDCEYGLMIGRAHDDDDDDNNDT